jgi:hypothetical protein
MIRTAVLCALGLLAVSLLCTVSEAAIVVDASQRAKPYSVPGTIVAVASCPSEVGTP